MSEIKLNQEMISALQNCKDAKAIMAFAKSKGVEISEEQAGKFFVMFQNDKLTDEELGKVVGGGEGGEERPSVIIDNGTGYVGQCSCNGMMTL